MQNLEEIWRPIEGYPDYEISSFGRVRNKETGKYPKITVSNRKGYAHTKCSFVKKHFYLSRLVAKAFPEICGEWFSGCEVHHIDKNPENNRADNLKVCTMRQHKEFHHDEQSEAAKKRIGFIYFNCGKKFTEEHRRKISDKQKKKPIYQYTLDDEFVREWESSLQIERELGYYHICISKCCRGILKKSYGFKWRFKSDVENEKQNNPG